jgi:4-hydroxy-2-oxoheptanedioate aldolase
MSRIRDVWEGGGAAHGAWLSLPSSVSAEVMARAGFDYCCVDMQHGLADYHAAVTMLQAVGLGDSTPLVRVPWNEPGIIGRMLDAGAMGIIIPMVNTVAEAEAAVAACRYAPAGARSFGPIRAAMQEGPTYFERANAEVACIPMIETTHAIANLDDILAVPGIDAVYVGPADLSVTLGLPPGNNDDAAAFTEALEAIVAACGRAGVVPGIHASAALAQRRREQGFRLMTIATDLGSLMAGARSDLKIALSESAPQEGDTRRVY